MVVSECKVAGGGQRAPQGDVKKIVYLELTDVFHMISFEDIYQILKRMERGARALGRVPDLI